MRLGAYKCKIKNNSLAKKIYEQETISERHRHRYEVNILLKEKFEKLNPNPNDEIYIKLVDEIKEMYIKAERMARNKLS